uniref:MIER family member 2 n=4 Tax=Rodentia TaxID=9989 RepID=A0A287D4Y0_ICTTR
MGSADHQFNLAE